MKKVIIASIALFSFSIASIAQAPAAKKNTASKMQVVKNTTDKKAEAKVVKMDKVTKSTTPAVAKTTVAKTTPAATKTAVAKTTPAATKTTVAKTAPVATKKVSATSSTGLLKKDGTPDKRYKENQGVAKGSLRKDGSPDKRYKANKKSN